MGKALDGRGLEAYYHQLVFSQKILEMIARIQASRPSDALYLTRGSISSGYPSQNMGRLIRAESHKLEFSSILEFESCNEYEKVDY